VVKISGKSIIMENPGGGSIHSSQKVGATTTTTTSATPSVVAAKTAEGASDAAKAQPTTKAAESAPAASGSDNTFEVNEKVQSKFSEDGRWYNAVIRGIKGDLYNVYYSDYGNSEFVPISSLKKSAPQAAAKGKPAQSANPKQQANNNRNTAQRSNNKLER